MWRLENVYRRVTKVSLSLSLLFLLILAKPVFDQVFRASPAALFVSVSVAAAGSFSIFSARFFLKRPLFSLPP